MNLIELDIENIKPIQFEGLLLDFFSKNHLPLSSVYVKCEVSSRRLDKDTVETAFHHFQIAEKPTRPEEAGRPLANITCQDGYPGHVVVLIREIGNDSLDWENVNMLVEEIYHKAKQEKFNISSEQIQDPVPESPLPPWERVDEHFSDRMIVELWHKGLTCSEIALKVNLSADSVKNIIWALRKKYDDEIVPWDWQRGRKS